MPLYCINHGSEHFAKKCVTSKDLHEEEITLISIEGCSNAPFVSIKDLIENGTEWIYTFIKRIFSRFSGKAISSFSYKASANGLGILQSRKCLIYIDLGFFDDFVFRKAKKRSV